MPVGGWKCRCRQVGGNVGAGRWEGRSGALTQTHGLQRHRRDGRRHPADPELELALFRGRVAGRVDQVRCYCKRLLHPGPGRSIKDSPFRDRTGQRTGRRSVGPETFRYRQNADTTSQSLLKGLLKGEGGVQQNGSSCSGKLDLVGRCDVIGPCPEKRPLHSEGGTRKKRPWIKRKRFLAPGPGRRGKCARYCTQRRQVRGDQGYHA